MFQLITNKKCKCQFFFNARIKQIVKQIAMHQISIAAITNERNTTEDLIKIANQTIDDEKKQQKQALDNQNKLKNIFFKINEVNLIKHIFKNFLFVSNVLHVFVF